MQLFVLMMILTILFMLMILFIAMAIDCTKKLVNLDKRSDVIRTIVGLVAASFMGLLVFMFLLIMILHALDVFPK